MKQIKDGYYLSIYSCIDPIFHMYHSSDRHDHNMSLWYKEGNSLQLLHSWEIERITGMKKHGIAFQSVADAHDFINKQLKPYNVSLKDMQEIIGTPGLSTINDYYQPAIFDQYAYHAIAHVFSAALSDSRRFYKENILSLSLDGGPDYVIDSDARFKAGFVAAYSKHGSIIYENIPSPGLFWSYVATKKQTTEGALMALAYASESASYDFSPKNMQIPDLYSLNDLLRNKTFIDKIDQTITDYVDCDVGKRLNYYDSRFTEDENKISMLTKIVQEISIIQVTRTVESLLSKWNIEPSKTILSLSGGYALNCPTNTYLKQKFSFKDSIIMPATNDGGMSIGMALMYFYYHMKEIQFQYRSPYYGDMDLSINRNLCFYSKYIISAEQTYDHFVEDIEEEPILWFEGCAEIGPRALGHRSILADPRQIKSKELINQYKQRQWWRPVAPIVLEEYRSDWFEDSFYSPYMLHNFPIVTDKKKVVPAIVHLDGTCRIQSLTTQENPTLYRCMQYFMKETGVPILCNTSLNDKNEPIINTISQTFNFALRKNISTIYVNGYRIKIKNHKAYTCNQPLKRYGLPFKVNLDEQGKNKVNPYQFSKREYEVCCSVPQFYQAYKSGADKELLIGMIHRFIQLNDY